MALIADATKPDFVAMLSAIQAQAPGVPVAFMCRRGDCTAAIMDDLSAAGISEVFDIVGGYYGTRDVKGWSRLRLPIRNIDMSISGLVSFTQP